MFQELCWNAIWARWLIVLLWVDSFNNFLGSDVLYTDMSTEAMFDSCSKLNSIQLVQVGSTPRENVQSTSSFGLHLSVALCHLCCWWEHYYCFLLQLVHGLYDIVSSDHYCLLLPVPLKPSPHASVFCLFDSSSSLLCPDICTPHSTL